MGCCPEETLEDDGCGDDDGGGGGWRPVTDDEESIRSLPSDFDLIGDDREVEWRDEGWLEDVDSSCFPLDRRNENRPLDDDEWGAEAFEWPCWCEEDEISRETAREEAAEFDAVLEPPMPLGDGEGDGLFTKAPVKRDACKCWKPMPSREREYALDLVGTFKRTDKTSSTTIHCWSKSTWSVTSRWIGSRRRSGAKAGVEAPGQNEVGAPFNLIPRPSIASSP